MKLFALLTLSAALFGAASITVIAPSDVDVFIIATGQSTTVSVYSTKRDIAFFTVTAALDNNQTVSEIVYPGPNGSADYANFGVPSSQIQSISVSETMSAPSPQALRGKITRFEPFGAVRP